MIARHLYLSLAGLAGLASLGLAQDVLFPHMHGLKYSELDQAVKLGLTTHVCKDEEEWYGMTTADFAKYKAIVIPDCMCNTSLTTIKFLDDTKKTWSPAVTGNMVIIGTDPSFHAKWYNLPGAYAMMRDSISLVSTGKNGTGMYFSLSCYYQRTAAPMTIQSLSEIGHFQVRGNLSHPCLNNAHLVAKSGVMTTLNDTIASNWNCSVHEAFSEYPRAGAGSFEALAIALNATGLGQRSFADNTTGIPYIIARGATPLGCGNNITEPAYNEECDNGPANGTPGDLCSSSCKCLHGVIAPGTCRSNVTSSSPSSTYSSTQFSNSGNMAPSTTLPANTTSSSIFANTAASRVLTNSSSTSLYLTGTAPSPSYSATGGLSSSNFSGIWPSSTRSLRGPPTVTVFPPGPPSHSAAVNGSSRALPSSLRPSNHSGSPFPPPETVTVTAEPPSPPSSPPETVTVLPPSYSESLPGTASSTPLEVSSVSFTPSTNAGPGVVTVTAPGPSETPSEPGSVSVRTSNLPGTRSPSGSLSVGSSASPESSSAAVTALSSQSPEQSSASSLESMPGVITVTATVQPETPTSPGTVSVLPSHSFGNYSGTVGSLQTSPTPKTATTPAVVTVTASGEPVTNSPPGTVTVEPSGSETSSEVPATPKSQSRGLPSASQPGDITVTVPGQPGTPSSPGTVTLQPSDSSGYPSDTTESPAQSVSSSTQKPTAPLTVTVGPPGESTGSSQPLSSINSGAASGQPSVVSETISESITGPPPGQTITVQPPSQSRLSSEQSGTASNSMSAPSSSQHASPPGSQLGASTVTLEASSSGGPSQPGSLGSSRQPETTPPVSGVTASSSGQPGKPGTSVASPLSSLASESSGLSHTPYLSSSQQGFTTNEPTEPTSGAATTTVIASGSVTNTAEFSNQPLGSSGTSGASDALGTLSGLPVTATLSPPGEPSHSQPLGSSTVTSAALSASASSGTRSLSLGIQSSQSSWTPGGPISGLSSGSASGVTTAPSLTSLPPVGPSDSFTLSASGEPGSVTVGFSSGSYSYALSESSNNPEVDSTSAAGAGSGALSHTFPTSAVGSASNNPTMLTVVSGQVSVTGRASSTSNAPGTALPSSTGQCDTWIGIEVIYMMEITEVCPEGATITETITECVATMTRSICQTSATNYPCYPCIMGSPASSEDTATVTVTSCSASTEPTVTITVQLCSTCTTSTYIGTVPGYTPGGPCHDCTSYQPSSSSPPLPPSPTVETITATATATATVIDSTGCTESETRPPTNSPQAPSPPQESVSQPQTASPEPTTDNTPNSVATATPHLPSTTESAPSPPEPTDTIPGRPSLTSGAPSSSGLPEAPQPEGYSYLPPPEGLTSSETAPAPSNTPHLPTAVPPPAVVTAGGAKNMAGLGVAVVGVLMGALLGI